MRDGHSTVRFGYHIAKQICRETTNVSAANHGPYAQLTLEAFWQNIWSIKLPSKSALSYFEFFNEANVSWHIENTRPDSANLWEPPPWSFLKPILMLQSNREAL